MRVTCTFARAAPLGSVTVPLISEFCCANVVKLIIARNSDNRSHTRTTFLLHCISFLQNIGHMPYSLTSSVRHPQFHYRESIKRFRTAARNVESERKSCQDFFLQNSLGHNH